MNSNRPRKKMITICSTLVAIGLINLIISIYSKMTAQNQTDKGFTIYIIFSLIFTLVSSLFLILFLKNKDSRIEEINDFDRTRYRTEIPITNENALILKMIVISVFGGLALFMFFLIDFPQDALNISNIFLFLQHNIMFILSICFLLLCGFGSLYSINYYSNPDRQRYYNSAEHREQQK